jgi:drug/metabolite transporter (DMT)-like permease
MKGTIMSYLSNKENRGCIEILIGSVIWGSIGVFVMFLDQNGSTATLTAFLRVAFACLIMAILTIYRYGMASFLINKRALTGCAVLGLLCHGIYNICYNLAIIKTGIAISAVMLNTSPVFTAVTAHMIFSEHFTKNKVFALCINIGGCILAITDAKLDGTGLSFYGICFGLAAGYLYALTPIIGRITGNCCNPFVMSTYSYLFATICLAVWDNPVSSISLITPAILTISFFYALIPTSIAYLIYYLGVQKVKETSKVPVIASVETISAIAFGIVLFGEQLNMIQLIGIIIVLLSIFMMSTQKKKKSLPVR